MAALWFVLSIGLGFYLVIGTLIALEFAGCPEDDYECPV